MTLSELKSYLNISGTTQDTFLTTCLNGAIDYVNRYCNRYFNYGTYTDILDGSKAIGVISGTTWNQWYVNNWSNLLNYGYPNVSTFQYSIGNSLNLRNYPLLNGVDSQITVLQYLDETTNTWTDLITGSDTINNSVEIDGDTGMIKLLKYYVFPFGKKNIKVTYKGGYFSTWVASNPYVVGDAVINGTTYYTCKTANSDATFTGAKWDSVTTPTNNVLLPYELNLLISKIAYLFYKESPAGVGGGRLGLNSENTGGQSSVGVTYDLAVMDRINNQLFAYKNIPA